MSSVLASREFRTIALPLPSFKRDRARSLRIAALTNDVEPEVRAFLSLRPLHTVFMAGLIHDNGLVSNFNRGTFYGARNERGALTGVALIGNKTIIEARSEDAHKGLMRLALSNREPHLIRGEQTQINRLLDYAQRHDCSPQLVCDELLLNQTAPRAGVEGVDGLRPATLDETGEVVNINAVMAHEECGVSPLNGASDGIYRRAERRVGQGRVWVLTERGRIIFKADVISETPEASFIEGVYVHPEERGRGYGLRCLTELGRKLLTRAPALCLVVNQANKGAQALYQRAGYQLHSHYRTVYFQQ